MIRNSVRVTSLFALLATAVSTAHGRVGSTTLKALTVYSDGIAVAKVERVEKVGGVSVATAKVVHPLKGLRAQQQVAFLAEGTWTCDTSYAVVGETVLLFLQRPGAHFQEFIRNRPQFQQERTSRLSSLPFFQIAYAGRGRMPLQMRRGQSYLCVKKEDTSASTATTGRHPRVVFWNGTVQLPSGIRALSSPGPGKSVSWFVQLEDMEHAILELLKGTKLAKGQNGLMPPLQG
jgi:hypothetical protein